jgi:predicted transcriptional regulator
MSETTTPQQDLVSLTVDIVSAYVSNNSVSVSDVPALVGEIHKSLKNLGTGTMEKAAEPLVPAVAVKKSIQPDFITCLEDGRRFKALKRHLRSNYNMTPAEYRTKWNLPHDYPMVAPNYSKTRSALAKSLGLGRKAARSDAVEAAPRVEEAPAAPKERSRTAKVAKGPRKPRVKKEQAVA